MAVLWDIDPSAIGLLRTGVILNWEKQNRATGGILAIDWDGISSRFR